MMWRERLGGNDNDRSEKYSVHNSINRNLYKPHSVALDNGGHASIQLRSILPNFDEHRRASLSLLQKGNPSTRPPGESVPQEEKPRDVTVRITCVRHLRSVNCTGGSFFAPSLEWSFVYVQSGVTINLLRSYKKQNTRNERIAEK